MGLDLIRNIFNFDFYATEPSAHCELSRHSGGKAYFLSYRDAAKAYDGLKRARTRAYVS
jgi:hypothetical protein